MITLLNPRSARHNRRIPLSLLTVAAGLEGRMAYEILDENFESNVEQRIIESIRTKGTKYVGLTVMPGPQLVRAIEISRHIKRVSPGTVIIWGGTFPSIHTEVVLASGYVDFVVLGQGEVVLPSLLNALEKGSSLENVNGIAFVDGGRLAHTNRQEWVHPDERPPLPYHSIDVYRYLQRTHLGNRTTAYHSSLGCPFKCGFCSVVSMYNGTWLAQSAQRVAAEIILVKEKYGVDSVEFFDDNFFTSERRIAEFSERIRPYGLAWWGEGRSDTIVHYSDRTLQLMKSAGCRMIFTGAETGSAEAMRLMNKGGTQTPELILEFAGKMKAFDIVPEFSFVLGTPSGNVDDEIDTTIRFIKKIKNVNPKSEIILYVYAPVLVPGATIFEEATKYGFEFPRTLDEWTDPRWKILDLRKKPITPWIKPEHIRKIRNFERVLNATYPSVTDLHLTDSGRRVLSMLGGWRYRRDFYAAPFEIRFFLSTVFNYRQPELEGAAQYPATS